MEGHPRIAERSPWSSVSMAVAPLARIAVTLHGGRGSGHNKRRRLSGKSLQWSECMTELMVTLCG
jgi:hypothetical protein